MIDRSVRFIQCVAIFVLCAGIAGCATTRKPPAVLPTTPVKEVKPKGVYHKVNKGETLWRISKTYKISVEEIIQANHIPSAASIEENQLLLIPGVDVVKDVIPSQTPGGKDTDYWWPLKGKIVSYFEDHKGTHVNLGLDIKGAEGEPVKAAREGRVVFADHLAGYASTLMLDHGDGFFTVYGHNDRLLVKLGDYVFRGEKVAVLGVDAQGSVMHFELRKGDSPKNPLHYLPREM
ncbi:MAG: peptidoglycan DD-metalloendopeptidase family protein [Candidatus Omnitrophica bacterium]|nr:peptidoglycan DD-metalloendopeptidase family protein [Candidatus Omnitrophota bacterium]